MVLDLIVIGVLLISAAVAFWRGFVREVLTIGSLLGAAAATYFFGPNLTPMVRGWIIDPAAKEPQQLFGIVPYEMLAPVIAFAMVFTATLIVLTIATHLIARGVHSVGLGPVDRSLGVVFGLVRGVMIVALMGLIINFVLSDEQQEQYFGESKTFPAVAYSAALAQALMPDREVLEGKAKKKTNAALSAVSGSIPGREPLEPGQTGRSASSSSGAAGEGYTAAQRKAIGALVEPQVEKARKRFND